MIRALALALALSVAGCAATSTGTSGFGGGPEAAEARQGHTAAKREARAEGRALRKAAARTQALKKRVASDRKRLGKLTGKRRSKAEARLKKSRAALAVAVRAERKERRDLKRAERRVAKAERLMRRAKAQERREKRLDARREKRLALVAARRERGDGTAGRRGTAAWLSRVGSGVSGGLLGSRRDPALRFAADYRARTDGGWALPAIPVSQMPKRLLRQEVRYRTPHKPGTIVVDTGARFLYLVQGGGRAMRYGIGVGRQGFEWRGEAHVGWKQSWPKWTPPEEMIERQPELAKYCADCGGMPGGIDNPLGARALYLHANGKDTLYRLHGTPDWRSIGTAASSGCIRMINQDVIDLYERARTGAKVVVM